MNNHILQDLAVYGTAAAISRRVSPRRARKLRKRGESVQYVGRTSTGKAVYGWMLRIPPYKLFMRQQP